MKKRIFTLTLAVLMITMLFAGCGAAVKSDSAAMDDYGATEAAYSYAKSGDYKYDDSEYDTPEEAEMYTKDSAYSSDSLSIETEPGRLVILNADVSIETTDFNASIDALRENVAKFGGFISGSNSSIYNSAYSLHDAYYTVRIPAENFNSFVAEQDAIGFVNYCNVWSDDVTSSYRDIEARLETLRTKYDRLLAMLEKADVMSDIIDIENALSETTYEIESYESCLKSYDDRIKYSTVTVSIREVREVVEPVEMPKTLGERIAIRFKVAMRNTGDFFEDFIVGFVGALPGIVIIAVIAAVIIVVVLKTRPRRLLRREKRREKNERLVRELREKRDSSMKTKNGGRDE